VSKAPFVEKPKGSRERRNVDKGEVGEKGHQVHVLKGERPDADYKEKSGRDDQGER